MVAGTEVGQLFLGRADTHCGRALRAGGRRSSCAALLCGLGSIHRCVNTWAGPCLNKTLLTKTMGRLVRAPGLYI